MSQSKQTTEKNKEAHKLNWFKQRVGKKIYRLTKLNCCRVCNHVEKHGLIIEDIYHAEYLHDCQNEMGLIYSEKLTKHKNK